MKNVVVYTSNNCAYCKQVKEHLNDKGVTFSEKNVSTDTAARKELMVKGYMGVPVVIVNEDVLQGYDAKKLDALLEATIETN